MNQSTSFALTRDLFQLIKLFPHPKFKQGAFDGLTRSEYELLMMLVMNRDTDGLSLSVTELGNRLQITPAGVTHLINPLEEAGYIERLQAPNDRRIVLIGLTQKGAKMAEALIAEVQEQLGELVSHLGEDDSRTLIRLISKSIAFFSSQSAT